MYGITLRNVKRHGISATSSLRPLPRRWTALLAFAVIALTVGGRAMSQELEEVAVVTYDDCNCPAECGTGVPEECGCGELDICSPGDAISAAWTTQPDIIQIVGKCYTIAGYATDYDQWFREGAESTTREDEVGVHRYLVAPADAVSVLSATPDCHFIIHYCPDTKWYLSSEVRYTVKKPGIIEYEFEADDCGTVADDPEPGKAGVQTRCAECEWPEQNSLKLTKKQLCPDGEDFTILTVPRTKKFCWPETDPPWREVAWTIRESSDLDPKIVETGLFYEGTDPYLDENAEYYAILRAGKKGGPCPVIIRAYDAYYPDCYVEAEVFIGCAGGCSSGNCEPTPGSEDISTSTGCASTTAPPRICHGELAPPTDPGDRSKTQVSANFSLGNDADGDSVGRLQITGTQPSPWLASPRALRYPGASEQVTVMGFSGDSSVIETIDSVECHVEVIPSQTLNDPNYQIQFFAPNGVNPYLIWEVNALTDGQNPPTYTGLRLIKIVDMDGSGATVAKVYEYLYTELSPGDWTWTLYELPMVDGDIVRQTEDRWEEDEPLAGRWRRTYTRAEGGVTVHDVQEVWAPTGADGQKQLMSRTVDPGGLNVTTEYGYYDETSDYEGWTEYEMHPDGSWVYYKYADSDPQDPNVARMVEEIRPWKDTQFVPGTTTPTCDGAGFAATVTRYDENERLYSVKEYADGLLVGWTAYAYEDQSTTELVKTRRYDLNGGLNVLETWTTYPKLTAEEMAAGALRRPISLSYPDAQQDSFNYQRGDFTWTQITTGQFSFNVNPSGLAERVQVTHGTYSSPDGIAGQTTRDVTCRDADGRIAMSETWVYTGTAYERIEWTATEYDDYGRATHTYHSNGTTTATVYQACCNERTVTDATGITTTYKDDVIGRPETVEKAGDAGSGQVAQITEYIYGTTEGLPSETVCEGYGSPLVCLQARRTIRDLAGRVYKEQVLDPDDLETVKLETVYAYSTGSGGGRTVTTTRPDSYQEITEYFRDGRTKSVTGSGVVDKYYDYAVSAGQQSTIVGVLNLPTGAATDRYVKTTYDMFGRVMREERPGFGGSPIVSTYAYNALGRLRTITTTDQPVILYAYNDLGQQTRATIRVQDIDPQMENRITETHTYYEKIGNDWWHTTSRWVYEEGDATPTGGNVPSWNPLSKSSTRLTGLAGDIIHESEAVDGFGVSTRTKITHPASTKDVIEETDFEYAGSFAADAVASTTNGLLTSSQTRTGVTYSYDYDEIGRRTSVTDSRTNNPTFTEYDAYGVVRTYTTADGTEYGAVATETKYGHNPATGQLDWVMQRDLDDPADPNKFTRYDYDPLGNVVHVWGDLPQPVAYTYTPYGERSTMTTYRTPSTGWEGTTWPNPSGGDTTTWVYDLATGLLDYKQYADQTVVDYDYYTDGNLKTRAWARGAVTRYFYNAVGELKQVDYGDDATIDLEFTYDRRGRILHVTDSRPGGPEHSFDYHTDADWPTLVQETISGGPFGRDYVITHEMPVAEDGRLATIAIDDDGLAPYDEDYLATYHYEESGRMSRVTGPGLPTGTGADHGAHYTYRTGSDLLEYTYFKNGGGVLLAQARRQYEAKRDLVDFVENKWIGDTPQLISKYDYTNDTLGRRTDVAYSGAAFFTVPASQSFEYNDRNELTDSERTDGNQLQWGYSYDPIGNRVWHLDRLTELTYETNALNQYGSRLGGSMSQGLRHDLDGNLTEMFVAGDMDCDGDVDTDDLECLWDAMDACPDDLPPDYDCSGCPCLNGDFDGDGDVDEQDEDFILDALDAGGLRQSFTWDAENRLVAVQPGFDPPGTGDEKVAFAYDYRGRRVRKTVETWNGSAWTPARDTAYVWDGWKLLLEIDLNDPANPNDDAIARKYTWGLDLAGQSGEVNSLEGAGTIGGLLAVHDANATGPTGSGGDYIFFYDANGNVGQLVAWATGVLDDGQVDPPLPPQPLGTSWHENRLAAYYEYDPYGRVIRSRGPYADENAWRFSTKQFDDETGFGYWGYRYYSPALGRWMSRDPIGEVGGSNVYSYGANAPAHTIDDLGLIPPAAHGGADLAVDFIRSTYDCCEDKCKKQKQCKIHVRAGVLRPGTRQQLSDAIGYLEIANIIHDSASLCGAAIERSAVTAGAAIGEGALEHTLLGAIEVSVEKMVDRIEARHFPMFIWYKVERRACELERCYHRWYNPFAYRHRYNWTKWKSVRDWKAYWGDQTKGPIVYLSEKQAKEEIPRAIESIAEEYECGSQWEENGD